MFKKNDYIVTLKLKDSYDKYNCARVNYCFKQRIDNGGIYPVIDLSGSGQNGHAVMSFDKEKFLKDWRYATQQEIAKYNELGKPFDVTTITNPETPQYEIY